MRRTDGGIGGAAARPAGRRRGRAAALVLLAGAALAIAAPRGDARAQPAPRPGQPAAGRPLPTPPPQPTPPAAAQAPAIATPAPSPVAGGAAPPHEWLYGTWTGGLFPAADDEGPRCLGQPTLVVTRDVVMRVASLDVAYRQRPIETVSLTAGGLEVRLVPVAAPGARLPPDLGFGCTSPDLLRVERRGPNEIVLPNCSEFPAPLKRCLVR